MCFPRGAPTRLFWVEFASRTELRMNSNSVPCTLFDPDFRVVLTLPPPVRPIAASYVFVITLNSWIASTFGATCQEPVRLIGAPFRLKLFVPDTPPFITYAPDVSQPRVPE